MAQSVDVSASFNELNGQLAPMPASSFAEDADRPDHPNIPPNPPSAQFASVMTSPTQGEPLASSLGAPSVSSLSSSGASSTELATELCDHESKANPQPGFVSTMSHSLSDRRGTAETGNMTQTGGGVLQYLGSLVHLLMQQLSSGMVKGDNEKGTGFQPPTQLGDGRDSSGPSVFAPGRKELASMITRLKNQKRSHERLQRGGWEVGGVNTPVGVQSGNIGSTAEGTNDGLSEGLQPTSILESEFDLVVHVPPDAYMTFSTHIYFEELKKSSHAQHASIISVRRFGDKYSRKHRCLVLHIARDGMPNFGLRVDCLRDHTVSLFQSIFRRDTPQVLDRVIVSGDQNLLYDDISGEEAVLNLPQPVSLLKFGTTFETVLAECRLNDRFAKEHCWFVVSALEELFVDTFGAGYTKGEPMTSSRTGLNCTQLGNAFGHQGSE